jgi:hypothetical protein
VTLLFLPTVYATLDDVRHWLVGGIVGNWKGARGLRVDAADVD